MKITDGLSRAAGSLRPRTYAIRAMFKRMLLGLPSPRIDPCGARLAQ
jgi:hypothetical protein